MPRRPHPTSGYDQIVHDDDLSDDDDDESSALVANHPSRIISIQPQPRPSSIHPASSSLPARPNEYRRQRSSSTVDLKVINARLERWADQIANKFKFKKDRSQHEHPPLEILHSVFSAPDGYHAPAYSDLPELAEVPQLNSEQFEQAVESVRTAISKGIDPLLIKQGSSGSYFMRDSDGKIVAVFKPKDEEPYVTTRVY